MGRERERGGKERVGEREREEKEGEIVRERERKGKRDCEREGGRDRERERPFELASWFPCTTLDKSALSGSHHPNLPPHFSSEVFKGHS